MPDTPNNHGRKRGRGARPWLIMAKFIGLIGFLGGLGSLGAMGTFGPTPDSQEGWLLLKGAMRGVFFPCVFSGLVLTVLAGIALLMQHPRVFFRMRWFQLKFVLLLIFVPSCHLWARGRVTRLYEAIDAGSLEVLPALWRDVTTAYLVAVAIFITISAVGRVKPRLGEQYGVRAPKVVEDEDTSRAPAAS